MHSRPCAEDHCPSKENRGRCPRRTRSNNQYIGFDLLHGDATLRVSLTGVDRDAVKQLVLNFPNVKLTIAILKHFAPPNAIGVQLPVRRQCWIGDSAGFWRAEIAAKNDTVNQSKILVFDIGRIERKASDGFDFGGN